MNSHLPISLLADADAATATATATAANADTDAQTPALRHLQRRLRSMPIESDDHLHAWIRVMLGLNVRRRPLVEGHAAPFDYLRHAFFEDRRTQRNAIIWAARGTGKTLLGAVATVLDLIYKPGIQVCILGGSFAQSQRMHEHLRRMFEDEVFADLVRGSITATGLRLHNGSRVDILCHSQTNIRGRRAHRLRCDEVELFDPDAWEAAQMITRSGRCGDVHVRAGVEALSTMHRPFGLMSRLVDAAGACSTRIFRWSVIDVLERCPDERRCEGCPLFDEREGGCHGRAKTATGALRGGFFHIDDAIDQKSRVSPAAWRSEMLCQEPDVSDSVYPEFSEAVHVFDDDTAPVINESITWLGGIDFGYRAPTALLLAALDGMDVLHVMDEIVRSGCPTQQFIELAAERCAALGMRGRGHSRTLPLWIAADPAGHQRSDQSGVSTISLWRKAGFMMRARSSHIDAGLESVRARLRSGKAIAAATGGGGMGGGGGVGLRIHRRCAQLIRAMREYHYSPERRNDPLPIKDGPDHACDALRYLVINLDGVGGGEVAVRRY